MNKSLMYRIIATVIGLLGSSSLLKAQGSAGGSNEEFLYSVLVAFGLLFLVIILVLNNVIKSLAANSKLWKKKGDNSGSAAAIVTGVFILSSSSAFAVSPDASVIGVLSQYSTTFWLLVTFDVFLAVIIIAQLAIFRRLIESLREQEAAKTAEVEVEVEAKPQENAFMKKIMKMLTRSVPVEHEEDVLTDHEYDGIRELDNVLPPWWVAMFYVTIIFGFVYLVHYHVLGTGDLQIAEYRNAVEQADAEVAAYMALAKAQVDESNVTVVTDASRLAKGEEIYTANCVTCHGDQGQGGVGPNFADQYWIHGGSINDLFATIKYGVPSKGMISWRAQLTPTQMQDVASYILTFQGTNPPNQKEPQGELYAPETPEPPEEGTEPATIEPVDSAATEQSNELSNE